MSIKTKKILKFILTIGIVLSAVAALFAVIVKTQRKLHAVDRSNETDDDEGCSGSCADCGMCDVDDSADEAESTEE